MTLVFDDLHAQRRAAGLFVVLVNWLMVLPIILMRVMLSQALGAAPFAAFLCACCATLVSYFRGDTSQGRAIPGVCLMAQISILLAASEGQPWQIDLHMAYFAALALLIVYGDGMVILTAAVTVAIHHLALSAVIPALVFPDSAGLGRVALHAGILIVEAGTLMWVAGNLNNMFAVSSRALARAEQAVEDARGLTLVANDSRQSEDAAKKRADASEADALAKERTLVVGSVGKAMRALAAGDLGYRIREPLPGEYSQLCDNFNDAVTQLQTTVQAIATSTVGLRGISGSIATLSDGLSGRTRTQVAALEETAAALHEITATVRGSAEGARAAASAASDAKADAVRSGGVMKDAIKAMAEIEQSSGKITTIIAVIDEIAFQTNLLALNAGVEAARAGDAGRGFAVVAQEVRALAQRSAAAAKEIKALIDGSSSEVGRGVRLVGETGQALQDIVTQIAKIDSLISGIAQSSQQQALGIDNVSGAVTSMDQATQQNASVVDETSAAAANLTSEAEFLATLVGQFQVDAKANATSPGRLGSAAGSRRHAA